MANLPSEAPQVSQLQQRQPSQQGQQTHHVSPPQQQRHSLPRQFFQTEGTPDYKFEAVSPTAGHQESDSTVQSRSRRHEGDINPDWGLTKAGKKRQRLPLACQVCRKKKIRCSGEQPICKHCLRFSLPCVYQTTAQRRPRNSLKKESLASVSGRRDSTKSLEDRSASPSPPHQLSIAHPREQDVSPMNPPSNPLSSSTFPYDPFERHDGPSPLFTTHPEAVPSRPPAAARSLSGPASVTVPPVQSDIFGGDHQRPSSIWKPFGLPSQNPPRLPAVSEEPLANRPSPPQLNVPSPTSSVRSPKEVHTPLPPRNVLLKLVEIYFTHVNNQTYGFIHRPTFLRHIEENKVPDGLLYSICAISARFSASHAPAPLPRQANKEFPAYHAGEPYAIEARRWALRDFDKPTVQNVQTLLLLALHDFGSKKGQKAWMFAGMAIRMASALRLDREIDGDSIGVENSRGGQEGQLSYGIPEPRQEKVSWTEREIRRRTFWACFIMDRLNSTGMGRPHVIQESDCYVQLPTGERSFTFGIPIKTERLIPPPSSETASLHPHTHSMGSEAYLVRIVALWGRVTKYVNQGERHSDLSPPWKAGSGFAKLNAELQAWVDGLPYWLKYSTSNLADQVAISQAPSFVFMHVAYHTIVCTLHRFSVPSANMASERRTDGPSSPSWDPPLDFLENSVKMCFEHAKAISIIMAEVVSRSDCVVTAPFLGFAVFTANLFHLYQAFTPSPYVDETPEDAREYFATGLTVLSELRIWWGPLEMLYKAIRMLWQTKAHHSQTHDKPTPKQATPASPPYDGQWLTSATPIPTGTTPRPFGMQTQPNSTGFGEDFDTTGFIPLPGGNFGLEFVNPNLHSSMVNDDTFAAFPQTDPWASDPQYSQWNKVSPALLVTPSDPTLTETLGNNDKSHAVPPVAHGRPLSPFSNALYGFGRSLGRNEGEKSPALTKKDAAEEHKSVLEQIRKDENSVMPPPNLTPRGLTESTPITDPRVSIVSPRSGTPGSHLRNKSGKTRMEENKNDDGSEGEEAADLLVYFHARSGGGDSTAMDDSTEVGDERRPVRAMSESRASSPMALPRKRKREDVAELTLGTSQAEIKLPGIRSGNIFPEKNDGTGTAEAGRGLYSDRAASTGSVDLLNLLQRPPDSK